MTEVLFSSLMRTPENGNRRSRTLRSERGDVQLQGKLARLVQVDGRSYLIVRWSAEEAGEEGMWTHLIVDPRFPGLTGILSVGFAVHEEDSWAMAREGLYRATGVKL